MLAFHLARTEFAAGIAGLRLFIACIGIGTVMLSAVWMLGAVLTSAFDVNGRQVLGGDAEISDLAAPLPHETLRTLSGYGILSSVIDLRSSGRTEDGSAPIELRAVDDAYPLFGRLQVNGATLPDALAEAGGRFGALVQPTLLTRLGLSIGDSLQIGSVSVEIRGAIAAEPDRLGAGGLMIGPRVIVSHQALAAAGLLTQGSLLEYRYRIRLHNAVTPGAFRAMARDLAPAAGWDLRGPDDAAGRVRRIVDRTTTFLGITGVVALAIALSGAWAAAGAWVRKRSRTIALYRLSGAEPGLVAAQHGLILAGAALIGVLAGTLAATVLVAAAAGLVAGMLPVSISASILAPPAMVAAGTILLGIAGAATPAVAGASRISAGAAMRSGETAPTLSVDALVIGLLLIATAAGIAIVRLPATAIALKAGSWLLVAAAMLALCGWILAALIARLRPSGFAMSAVVRSLSQPKASAAKALAIGIGIAGITAVMSVQGSIDSAMRAEISERLPDVALLDIRSAQLSEIRRVIDGSSEFGSFEAQPNLRTIIRAVNGKPAPEALVNPRRSRMIEGDLGLSWTARPLPGALLAGKWWAPDYAGPTLISIEEDVADAFGIGPGDRMTLSVMGREIEGEVANVREEQDRSLRINFMIVTSPDPLRHAPHTWVGTLRSQEQATATFISELARTAPNITAIDIRQIVREVTSAIEGAMLGILAVAAVLLAAGGLSLAAVVAADTDARAREALVLSLVGASRREIATARLLEVAAIGLLSATVGGIAGLIGGWWLTTEALHLTWAPGPSTFLIPIGLGTLVAVAAGLFAGLGSMPRGRGEIARRLTA